MPSPLKIQASRRPSSARVGGPNSRRLTPQTKNAKTSAKGLKFERTFSNPVIAPFDELEWEMRTAEITDDSGKAIFKQEDVEVPKSWSALATKIAVSKYF